MRLAINLLYLLPGSTGGTETYARGLIDALASTLPGSDEILVYVNREAAAWPLPPHPGLRRVVCPVRAVSRLARYAYEQAVLPIRMWRDRVDILHSLNYVGPLLSPCRHVATLHDMNTVGHGSAMPLFRRVVLGAFQRATARCCDHVITVSEFSRSELIAHVGIHASKVAVIHEAPGQGADSSPPAEVTQRFERLRPYVMALSSPHPHKNIPALIRAFGAIRSQVPHRLIIAGHHPKDGMLRRTIEQCELTDRVLVTGYLDDAELYAAYRSADLFAFPSLYEGFGLPILEAQAHGVCVACSHIASLPEVAGGGAEYFDPASDASIASAIQRLLADDALRARKIDLGRENLKRFSWKKTGEETARVYGLLVRRQ